jgi:type I restriction enzyme M protein
VRWQYGTPPSGNANFAWVQHIVHHLSPTGAAGLVLANGSMSSQAVRRGRDPQEPDRGRPRGLHGRLPGQLFYSTQIPVCLWFLARDRRNGKFRDRRGQVLFIDARKLGPHGGPHPPRADRRGHRPHRQHLPRLARRAGGRRVRRRARLLQERPLDEVRKHGHVLTPGRYVGAEAQQDDGEPFEEKMKRLTATLREQQAEAAKLDAAIAANLRK